MGLLSGRYSQEPPKNEEAPANQDDGAPAKEAKPKVCFHSDLRLPRFYIHVVNHVYQF